MRDWKAPTRVPDSRRWGVVLGAALVVAAAGCSDDVDLPEQVPPPVVPTPVEQEYTPEEQAAIDGALEVFDLYISTFVRLAIEGAGIPGTDDTEQLHQYGSALHIPYEGTGLYNLRSAGWRGSGTIEWELLAITGVDVDGNEHRDGKPTVSFRACLDETGWTLVDADTGEAQEGPGERQVITVGTVFVNSEFGELRPEEAWRVSGWGYEEGETC